MEILLRQNNIFDMFELSVCLTLLLMLLLLLLMLLLLLLLSEMLFV